MASNDPVYQLRRLLECPVCLEQSSDQRVLPCLHSFCENCLDSHMAEQGQSGEFPCPLCKNQFPVPSEGASGFKHNFFHAGICDIVTNDDSLNKLHCSVHEDRVLEFYCEQCKTSVCSRCITSNHNQHRLQDLGAAAKKASEAMVKMLKPYNEVKEHWEMLHEERQQILQGLSQQQKSCRSMIHRLYSEFLAKISRQLNVNEEKAIAELDEQVEAARKRAKAASDEAEVNRGKFANVLDYVNNVLGCHDAEIVLQFNLIQSLLENLNVGPIETQVTKSVFKFKVEKFVIPSKFASTVTVLEHKIVPSKFSPKSATNVASVSGESPVHRVTSQLPFNETAQLVRKFSSLSSRKRSEGSGWCWGMAVGDGGLVVTDSENSNVKVFRPNGKTFKLKFKLNQAKYQLQNPWDVTCNNLGEIFITDHGIGGVVRYDAAGRVMEVYPGVYKSEGFITCHMDQLIVTDTHGGRVLFTDFDCKVHNQIDARSLGLSEFSPRYVCVDENSGHLVVSQYLPPRVYVIDHKQPAVILTFSDKLCAPRGVCVDQFGHILVTDHDKDHVILLSPARPRVITRAGDVAEPTAICTSGPGQVSVLESEGDVKIFKYLDV